MLSNRSLITLNVLITDVTVDWPCINWASANTMKRHIIISPDT
jgi:hypothetical protein